jgi:hypothetical protein
MTSTEEDDDLDSESQSPVSPFKAMHDRSRSSASISSVATFETAAEDVDETEQDPAAFKELDALTRPMLSIPHRDAHVQPPQQSSGLVSPTNARASILLGSPPSFLPSPPVGASMNRRLSQNMRPSSGLLSSFIGLDNVMATPETIQRDRALVESVVGALQRCCLELQRAPEDRRDVLRERLAETKRLLFESLDISSPRPTSSHNST